MIVLLHYWQLLVKRRWVSLLYDWFNDLDIFLVVQLFNDEWKKAKKMYSKICQIMLLPYIFINICVFSKQVSKKKVIRSLFYLKSLLLIIKIILYLWIYMKHIECIVFLNDVFSNEVHFNFYTTHIFFFVIYA